ncbi:hypothetical protein PANT_4c00027 [Moesziomyces antarcticus T-34]|uniref:Uncharacterized protein n=1 Tax=Pseudozyma antarctica (strain T-34) TaxID=1151754 RepID=M9MCD2_PSEA3|nr:hypothetical protein PANT_4c00027 [Moesziomyces antarcticus T-34]
MCELDSRLIHTSAERHRASPSSSPSPARPGKLQFVAVVVILIIIIIIIGSTPASDTPTLHPTKSARSSPNGEAHRPVEQAFGCCAYPLLHRPIPTNTTATALALRIGRLP